MISAQDFKTQWNSDLEEFEEGLVPLAEGSKYTSELPNEVIEFLSKAGLPHGAAPFLSFDTLGKDGLKKVYEAWGNPSDYSEAEKARLSPYFVIGADGAGNPIAIDTDNNLSVVRLDHEDRFNTIEFMNSSLQQLAKFLLVIRKMISDFLKSGIKRDSNDEIPIEFKKGVFDELMEIDPDAVKENGVWRTEIGML